MASQPVDVFPANPDVANGPQGRKPIRYRHPIPRDCPADFDVTFVTVGRFDCEAHYHARRDTITRWLEERGKQPLIDARAAHVADLRAKGEWMTRGTNLTAHREINPVSIRRSIRDNREVDDTVAREAAHFLRVVRHCGLIVSRAVEPGTWWVGSRRMSAAEMVDLARLKGFDPSA